MEWRQFVKKYYDERRATDKNYAFKSAMTDAKESYYSQSPGAKVKKSKKQLSGGVDPITEMNIDPPATPTAVVGGKKSKSKRYSKRRRTSKKR